MTPQSPMKSTPSCPNRVSSTSITMQLEAVVASGATLTIWNKRTKNAAGTLVGAGNKAIDLMHGQHHRAVIIGVEHRFARFFFLDALVPAQQLEPFDERGQILAFGGIDDAHAFQRDIQFGGGLFDLRCGRPARMGAPRRSE